MADVMIDPDKLKETMSVYSNYRRELETTLSSLKSAINYLQIGWTGATKNKFITDHFPKLCKDMEKHIEKIKILEKELGFVSDDFTSLDRELSSKS